MNHIGCVLFPEKFADFICNLKTQAFYFAECMSPKSFRHSFSESVVQLWWINVTEQQVQNVRLPGRTETWWNAEHFIQPSISLRISI